MKTPQGIRPERESRDKMAEKKKHVNKTRELLADEYIKALEEDRLPWKPAFDSGRESFMQNKNASTKTPYRGVNQLTLEVVAQSRGYRSDQWLTFSQMKKKGYSFRTREDGTTLAKGQGVPVEVFKPYDKQNKKNITFSEYDEIMRGDDEKHKQALIIFSKNYTVFNGDLINELYKEPEHNAPEMTPDLEKAEKVLQNYARNEGILITEEPVRCPYYVPLRDEVHMPPREDYHDMREFMQDLSHELSHSTGTRLNRDLSNEDKTTVAKEELIAEISASFTTGMLEIPPTEGHGLENTKAYVQDWISAIRDKPEALFDAISKAQKASDYICEKGEREKVFAENKEKTETVEKKPEPEPKAPLRAVEMDRDLEL